MKRFLLSIIAILAFAIGINAETYTHTFQKDELTTKGGNVTLSGIEWTASSANSIGWNNEKGIQFGSKSAVCANFSLTTSAFKDYTIKSVTVHSCIASSGDAKVTIQAGKSTSGQYTLTTSSTECKFECKEQGDITISWKATDRAYYAKKIEIEYELPAGMVDVEEPAFKTAQGVYENEVFVVAETSVASDTLYYTIDGTIPSFEEYHSEPRVGTTKRSGYPVLNETLKSSATIKAIAIRVDGESVYKSDVVEARYIVSETKPYIPAKEIATGKKYAFVAKDSVADFLFGATEGHMQSRKISGKYNKYIETVAYSGFTFTSTNGGYTIQDAEERYMYLANNDGKVSFATEKPVTGAVWSVAIDNNGRATIKNGNSTLYYVADEDIFGCYATVNNNMELPSLYMQREYPKAVITPENGSHVQGLKEFTISCEEGIAVSDNFSLKAQSGQREDRTYEINKTYAYKQVDKNTLKFTIDEELVSANNINIDLIITGDIYLNPTDMDYTLPIIGKHTRSICSYTHVSSAAAATITDVTPANEEKVERLSYILFTFSNIATSVDTSKEAKLYREGSNDTRPFTFTNLKEDGSHVAQNQGGLLLEEPATTNGTYILEIADGYFVDRNSKEIKGIKLKYIVENETGIEDIIAEGETNWVVYNITGVKVLDTDNAEDLNTLSRGIYIINNRKVIVR